MMNVSNKKNGIDGKESSQSKFSIQEAKGTQKPGLTTDLMITIIGGKKRISFVAGEKNFHGTYFSGNRVGAVLRVYYTQFPFQTFLYCGAWLSFLSRLKVVEEIGFPSLLKLTVLVYSLLLVHYCSSSSATNDNNVLS
jgi:hypothetical protein